MRPSNDFTNPFYMGLPASRACGHALPVARCYLPDEKILSGSFLTGLFLWAG